MNILQHDVFPLADTLDQILRIGQQEMGRPVEIEFAVNMDPSDHTRATFYLLQIRPIVDNKEIMDEDLSLVKNEETILSSTSVLGHGIVGDVQDIIYVKTGAFNSSNNQLIAYEIEKDEPFVYRSGERIRISRPRSMGEQRLLVGYSGEMAAYQ